VHRGDSDSGKSSIQGCISLRSTKVNRLANEVTEAHPNRVLIANRKTSIVMVAIRQGVGLPSGGRTWSWRSAPTEAEFCSRLLIPRISLLFPINRKGIRLKAHTTGHSQAVASLAESIRGPYGMLMRFFFLRLEMSEPVFGRSIEHSGDCLLDRRCKIDVSGDHLLYD